MTIPCPPACLIVADGVGGSASGELASLLTLDTIFAQLRSQHSEGALTSVVATGRAMLKALAITNQAIYTHAHNHPEHHGMATTVTLALTYDDVLLVAQIGDSRAYLIHAGTARQLTKDQSLVQRLIDVGELTEEEATRSPKRNIIPQALGSEPVSLSPTSTMSLRKPGMCCCSAAMVSPTISRCRTSRVSRLATRRWGLSAPILSLARTLAVAMITSRLLRDDSSRSRLLSRSMIRR